jgi:pimeloyl-ACP methyl ester carboxylesterase
MMNDDTIPDNRPDINGRNVYQQNYEQPYYEYASPVAPQAAQNPAPPPAYPWPPQLPQTPQPWQNAAPPFTPMPMSPSPWAQQGPIPPPFAVPSTPAAPWSPPQPAPRKRSHLVLYILGFLCVLAVVFGGTYTLTSLFMRSANQASTQHTVATAKVQSTSQATPVPSSATFDNAACPFQPGSGITEGKQLRCGFLSVLEDHANAQSPHIKLAVAVFTPTNAANGPKDPIVYLSGGPGGALLNGWANYVSSANLATITQGHTLIMFDQRGTGYSQPVLNCNEIHNLNSSTQNNNLSRAEGDALYIQAAKKCHDRLTNSGIDLNAYTSMSDAADVHDLVHALGYKQVDLYGVSYGTRLALTVMRLFPSDVRSVVLDSTVPTQLNLFEEYAPVTQHAYDTLFHGCAASPQCNSMYPQLDTVFYRLVDKLNAHPVTFNDRKYGRTALSGDSLANWVYSMLYVTELIPVLPKAIDQINRGDYTIISQYYGALMYDNGISDGMYYSVECGEDVAYTTLPKLLQSTSVLRPAIRPSMVSSLQDDFGVCQVWEEKAVPAAQKQPVASAIPTLILSGQYDPITPYSNALQAEKTLSHSFLFSFPGTGHGVFLTNACPDAIMHDFLLAPTSKPDATCIASMPEPAFA